MLSWRRLASAVDRSEQVFEECWQTLVDMKALKGERLVHRMLEFQPSLVSVVHGLNDLYRIACAEQEALIAKKTSFAPSSFGRRMRHLAWCRQMVAEVLGMARALGDCFVVFMYRRSPQMLNKHLKEGWQRHSPPGIGGKGEALFLHKAQGLHGHIVIYHGITNLLRLGDYSFLDIHTWTISAIGELKTLRMADGLAKFSLTVLTSDKESRLIKEMKTSPQEAETEPFEELSPPTRDRLDRQVRRFTKALSDKNTISSEKKVELADHTSQVASMLVGPEGAPSTMVCGSSLLCGVIKFDKKRLFDRLRPNPNLDREVAAINTKEKLDAHLKELFVPGSEFNGLNLSMVPYIGEDGVHDHIWGPPLFWRMQTAAAKALYFKHAFLWTAHNPARLIESIKEMGFMVVEDKAGRIKSFQKKLGSRTIELQGYVFFAGLVQHGLYSETTVLELIRTFTDSVTSLDVKGPARVELNLISELFGIRSS